MNIFIMLLITGFAYFVKGTLGFGEGLITISLFSIFLDIKSVLPLTLLLALAGGIYQFFHIKKDIKVEMVRSMALPLIIGVAIGTYMLSIIDSKLVKQLFAIFLILYSGKLLSFEREEQISKKPPQSSRKMEGIFALLSGAIDGFMGVGGVLLIIYLNYLRFDKTIFRATIVTLYIVLAISRTVTYAFAGFLGTDTFRLAVYLLPAVIAGVLFGTKMITKINEMIFRKIILLTLLLIGISLLSSSLF